MSKGTILGTCRLLSFFTTHVTAFLIEHMRARDASSWITLTILIPTGATSAGPPAPNKRREQGEWHLSMF